MFLYLAFMAVHTPFVGVPPKKFRKMISTKARKDTFEESPHDLRDMVLASVDDAIDKVILKLKETGLYNNSVILVTTDNGGGPWYSNSPLKGTKETMYEGGIRGASFLLSPLLARSGQSDQLIHLVDWLPTFLSLAGKEWQCNVVRILNYNCCRAASKVYHEEFCHILNHKTARWFWWRSKYCGISRDSLATACCD